MFMVQATSTERCHALKFKPPGPMFNGRNLLMFL
jgi:hypothetical protein